MTTEPESISIGRKRMWGFISTVRPGRYITTKGSVLMSLDDFLLLVGKLPTYEKFSNILQLLRAFECVAPARKTSGGRDHSWWKRDTELHQVIPGRRSIATHLPEVSEMNQFDGSRWFISEDWAYAIIEVMKKHAVFAEEVAVAGSGLRRDAMKAKVIRADGTFFMITCS